MVLSNQNVTELDPTSGRKVSRLVRMVGLSKQAGNALANLKMLSVIYSKEMQDPGAFFSTYLGSNSAGLDLCLLGGGGRGEHDRIDAGL